jgi:predicted nuclease of restriction endonuclease-like (RecB) superfamily
MKTRKAPANARVAPMPVNGLPSEPLQSSFAEVVHLIEQTRQRVYLAANTQLIELYWTVGEYVSHKIEADGWGRGTVRALSEYIQRRQPGIGGFSPQNIWRMRQFFETYRGEPELSPLVRVLPWTHNLIILGQSKRPEEREFYLRMAIQERWGKRELERQFRLAAFERTKLNPPKVSTALRVLHPESAVLFKDSYLVEFLNLPAGHSEMDLHRSLLGNLGRFLTELGRDFCFIGSEYLVQVGGQDFALDLLFYHRGLNSLVAIELKVGRFEPEHLGKLEFYLEALDRDVKKPHERPSVGVLLCASKDNEVVEYALSRSLSPALIAEYQTMLPDKALLQAKLHEYYQLAERAGASPDEQEQDGERP